MEFNLNLNKPLAKKITAIDNTPKTEKRKIECLGKCERKMLSDGSGTVCVGCGNSWATPNWNNAT